MTKKTKIIINTISVLVIFLAARHGWTRYVVNKYEAEVAKEYRCETCLFVDEEGGTFTEWDEENDSEFIGLKRNEDTGDFEPRRDWRGDIIQDVPAGYPGTKSLHIPMIRGFKEIDFYGEALCQPCRDAKTKEAIQACNDRSAYRGGEFDGFTLDDMDSINDDLGPAGPMTGR